MKGSPGLGGFLPSRPRRYAPPEKGRLATKGDELRKVRILVAAALAAVPLATMAARPASACPQYPCHTRCDVNPPFYVEGDVIYPSNRPLLDCYY